MSAPHQSNEFDQTSPVKDPLTYALSKRDRNVTKMVENAVRRKQVMLAFQPVILASGENPVAFYEGLIRVLDDSGRTIPAAEFIEVVEAHETGRIIDCLALECGFQALAEEPTLRLSINMSARSIGYQRWINTLHDGLKQNPSAGERLILEITETSAMQMPELVISFMENLQMKGISFALDDFGAGFTAFRHLRDFYFDILKIDGQFIRGIHTNPDNQVLARALIGIARQFDMLSVAESVESAADVNFLCDAGIDCLQGYYFAAPTVTPPWRIPAARKSA